MDDAQPIIQAGDDTHTTSNVFVKASDNTSLKVFAQVEEMLNRPKLAKALRRGGAEICKNPKEAEIILVDEETNSGKEFIGTWSRGENKTVLHYRWVYESLVAGRMLEEADDWGGFLTKDDGIPLEEIESGENEISNALPTPRQSPDGDPQVRKDESNLPTQSVSRSSPRQSIEQTMPTASTSENTSISSLSQGGIQTYIQGFGVHQPPADPSCLPTQTQSFDHEFLIQTQEAQNMPQGMNPPQAHSFGHEFSMQTQEVQNVPQGMNPPQPHSPLLNQQGVQLRDQHPDPANFYMALIDTIKFGSRSNELQQTTYPAQRMNSYQVGLGGGEALNTEGISHTNPESNPSHPDVPNSPRLSYLGNRFPVTPPSSASTPSVGKQKSLSAGGLPPRSLSNPLTSSQSRPPSPNKETRIFTTDEGKSLEFYVQIEFPNRTPFVSIIKKNGGKIQRERKDANYAILYSNAPTKSKKYKTFESLLTASVAEGVPAVSAQFVFDSVEQGILLDYAPYEFQSPNKRKRKRSEFNYNILSDDDFEKAEQKRLRKNQRRAERRQEAKEEADMPKKQEKTPKGKQKQSDGFHSPSPPPLTSRVAHGPSSFKYSEEERKFALRYARILLAKDSTISIQALGSAMHEKIPHHTMKAWQQYLNSQFRAEIDDLRKKAGIAYRKTQSRKLQVGQSSQNSTPHSAEDDTEHQENDLGTRRLPKSDGLGSLSLPEKLERDLEVVSGFFAYGGGDEDGQDRDVVWANLTTQTPCLTTPTWEDFYNSNHVEIMARYNKKLGAEDEQGATAVAISVGDGLGEPDIDDMYD